MKSTNTLSYSTVKQLMLALKSCEKTFFNNKKTKFYRFWKGGFTFFKLIVRFKANLTTLQEYWKFVCKSLPLSVHLHIWKCLFRPPVHKFVLDKHWTISNQIPMDGSLRPWNPFVLILSENITSLHVYKCSCFCCFRLMGSISCLRLPILSMVLFEA